MSQTTTQPHPTPTDRGPTLLRARSVHRAFHMGDSTITILKGADLTLRAGEFVAIEGRSGSGKSTLLHILGGLDGLDDGTLEFDGQDYSRSAEKPTGLDWGAYLPIVFGITDFLGVLATLFTVQPMRLALIVAATEVAFFFAVVAVWLYIQYTRERAITHLRNTQFGFVFQFYHLLPELNVLENTLLAAMIEHSWLGFRSNRRAVMDRATKLLDQVGLSHRLKHRPAQLSGGERQRVAIARALMNNPRVLFADEPTGNLDAETGRQIMNLLEKLHRENHQTIVMVTHDRALAREADRVLVLKDGKLEKAD